MALEVNPVIRAQFPIEEASILELNHETVQTAIGPEGDPDAQ